MDSKQGKSKGKEPQNYKDEKEKGQLEDFLLKIELTLELKVDAKAREDHWGSRRC